MQRLIDNDVEPGLAQEILAEIHENFAAENGLADEVVKMIVKNKVRDRLLTEDLPLRSRILAFVGPTGVGKTTTLAKLAAHFSLYRNQRTGIITIDTYRIGAVEQLRTYADITGIPIEVVMTPKEMPEALQRLADREVILVDTAGRNAKNTLHVSELAAFLAPLSAPEIFLVLSASTKANDMRLIIDSFRKVKYNRLIFTKMDETATYGVIQRLPQAELPVTYVTTGQNVPDDLEVADAEKIANLILGDEPMVDQAEQLRRLVSAVPQQRKILRRKRILRVITVTSGKGGVGKTSVVINLAIALALLGKRVVIMDADLGLANVDVIIGLVPVNTLHDVIRGKKTLTEIIITGPEGVKIIPGASGLEELANLTGAQRERLIESLLSLEDMADILLLIRVQDFPSRFVLVSAPMN